MNNGHVVPRNRSHLADRARTQLLETAEVSQLVAEQCVDSILAAAGLIDLAFQSGGKLLLCGNGGSAADCQHMASELLSRLRREVDRPGLPAIALTTDTSFLTAFANDCGFEGVFERQVETLGRPGDALIAISTSGESPNILRAVAAAGIKPMHTIGLTGLQGRLAGVVDVAIKVPSNGTQHIQEAHLAIEHVLCDLVEQSLLATLAIAGGVAR